MYTIITIPARMQEERRIIRLGSDTHNFFDEIRDTFKNHK